MLSRGGDPLLLLGGRSWRVTHVDWAQREAFVEAAPEGGKSRWIGSGQPLHFRLCRGTVLLRDGSEKTVWWTFAGQLCNSALSQGLTARGQTGASSENLWVNFLNASASLDDALRALQQVAGTDFSIVVSDDVVRRVKFSECLPHELAATAVAARLTDAGSVAAVLTEPIRHVSLGRHPSA
jgi:ATP-dependent Lhr-like helicase